MRKPLACKSPQWLFSASASDPDSGPTPEDQLLITLRTNEILQRGLPAPLIWAHALLLSDALPQDHPELRRRALAADQAPTSANCEWLISAVKDLDSDSLPLLRDNP